MVSSHLLASAQQAELIAQTLATLAYTHQFYYPLTTQEVQRRFLGKKVTLAQVQAALQELLTRGVIVTYSMPDHAGVMRQWWGVAAGSKVEKSQRRLLKMIQTRLRRHQRSQRQWQEVSHLVQVLQKIPWISAVAVTGSLAMNNVTTDDDTDFMIITAPRRLWLTRLVVTWWAWWKGKRRSWWGEEKRSWCFNLWLDETALAMPESARGVYTAYEVVQAQFVWDRTVLQKQFYSHNKWIAQYLGTWWSQHTVLLAKNKNSTPRPARVVDTHKNNWGGWCWDKLEELAFYAQYAYMKSHMTRERVSASFAFFHPRPTAKLIEKKWHQDISSPGDALLLPIPSITDKVSQVGEMVPQVQDALYVAKQAKARNQPVVLATGVFDVLHQEHSAFLQKAQQLGGVLLVGVETDDRVRSMKGPGRPINSLAKRIKALQQLQLATLVFALPAKFSAPEDREKLIAQIKPTYLAVSAHTLHQDKKRQLVEKYGGELKILHDYNPAISTTLLVQQRTVTQS